MGITIHFKGKLKSSTLIDTFITEVGLYADKAGWKKEVSRPDDTFNWHEELKGITLFPHAKCEPVSFHFDAEGTFLNADYYRLKKDEHRWNILKQGLRKNKAFFDNRKKGENPIEKIEHGAHNEQTASGDDVSVNVIFANINYPEQKYHVAEWTMDDESLLYNNFTKTQFAGADIHIAVVDLFRFIKDKFAPDMEIEDESGYFADNDAEKLKHKMSTSEYLIKAINSTLSSRSDEEEPDLESLESFIQSIIEAAKKAQSNLN